MNRQLTQNAVGSTVRPTPAPDAGVGSPARSATGPLKAGGQRVPRLFAGRSGVTERLALAPVRGVGIADGAWWPRSRDLGAELLDLDVAISAAVDARIARVTFTLGLWDGAPRKVRSTLGEIELGSFVASAYVAPPENPAPAELIELSLNDYTRLVLVVIPPDQDAALGTRALAEHGADPRHAALTGRVATEAGAGCSQPADSRVIGRVRADRLN
ncbi:MAG: DUF5994 family protein [Nostocoides sp.]|uniref:DUF5994 family protein n=1 Tax=Nostocoides sp. TaxID=1917966 RepID=UPI003C711693